MKILLINSVCGTGSTGKIVGALAEEFAAQGHEVVIAYGRDGTVPEKYKPYARRIGSDLGIRVSAVRTRMLDDHGFANETATKRFLEWAENYGPDLLWLHNLHGYYIHVGRLFDWIKSRPQMQVRWTLHDCWAFTGHCAYFTSSGCEKWKTGCHNCPEKGSYPASVLKDGSCGNYLRKKTAFTGVANMTLIVPSKWLGQLVRQSFLGGYPVEVCYNSIDTQVFRPTPGDFRKRYGLENKKLILGVASVWEKRKGLRDFLLLSRQLDENTKIVLVGLSPQQITGLPDQILGLPRVSSTGELAMIYTAADVLFNPTYEDTYPTVNLEAEACGTRVITYNAGGCAETIRRPDSRVIPVGQFHLLKELI